jgi:hypothetical protein
MIESVRQKMDNNGQRGGEREREERERDKQRQR